MFFCLHSTTQSVLLSATALASKLIVAHVVPEDQSKQQYPVNNDGAGIPMMLTWLLLG